MRGDVHPRVAGLRRAPADAGRCSPPRRLATATARGARGARRCRPRRTRSSPARTPTSTHRRRTTSWTCTAARSTTRCGTGPSGRPAALRPLLASRRRHHRVRRAGAHEPRRASRSTAIRSTTHRSCPTTPGTRGPSPGTPGPPTASPARAAARLAVLRPDRGQLAVPPRRRRAPSRTRGLRRHGADAATVRLRPT